MEYRRQLASLWCFRVASLGWCSCKQTHCLLRSSLCHMTWGLFQTESECRYPRERSWGRWGEDRFVSSFPWTRLCQVSLGSPSFRRKWPYARWPLQENNRDNWERDFRQMANTTLKLVVQFSHENLWYFLVSTQHSPYYYGCYIRFHARELRPNRRVFVYTFYLINICLSLSDYANKIKTLNIERAYQF